MKKKYFILCIICIMGILYGCASNPKELVLDKTQVAISYEKVESLDYWIIGKDLIHDNKDKIKKEMTVQDLSPKETASPRQKTEEQNTVKTVLSNNTQIQEKKDLTKEEMNEILKKIDNYNNSNDEETITTVEFVTLIDENIASFEQRERDLMIKKYMTSYYGVMNDLNSILQVIGYDLEEAVKEYDINVNDKKSIAILPDSYGTVRGFLIEVKDKGLFVNNNGNNEGFYIDLDLGNMLDKYRDYISPSLIAYMKFNNYEMNNILVDYDIEEIAKRIKMLEEGMQKDKLNHYIMADRYISSITYYYQLLLGLSHSNFTEKGEIFKQSVLEQYANVKGSSTLTDILNKTTLAIQTNEMVYDDKVKELVLDYVNSKIYTDELNGILDNENTYKYKIMTEEELKPVKKEKVETEEIDLEENSDILTDGNELPRENISDESTLEITEVPIG